MTHNTIHPIDDVRIDIYLDGHKIATYQSSGFHTVDEAIKNAYVGSDRTNGTDDDYVYNVTNVTTGTHARYRVNAGDHAVILPEERS